MVFGNVACFFSKKIYMVVPIVVPMATFFFNNPFWLKPFLLKFRVIRERDEFSLFFVRSGQDGASCPARDGAL